MCVVNHLNLPCSRCGAVLLVGLSVGESPCIKGGPGHYKRFPLLQGIAGSIPAPTSNNSLFQEVLECAEDGLDTDD